MNVVDSCGWSTYELSQYTTVSRAVRTKTRA